MLAADAFLAGCAMAGAKALTPLCLGCGPAEAVPLLQSKCAQHLRTLSPIDEAVPFQSLLGCNRRLNRYSGYDVCRGVDLFFGDDFGGAP